MREIIILSCTRCSHRWVQRGKEKPMQCAKCRSTYFAKPKVRFNKPKIVANPDNP